jgi:hypothetical protein
MARRLVNRLLVAALAAASLFAAWAWLRPYAFGPDPAAGCTIEGAQLRRDRSNYWLDLHLRPAKDRSFALSSPVRLRTAAGREIEPAATEFSPPPGRPATDIWFKFWLESSDLERGLDLRIQQGSLRVKSTDGIPAMDSGASRYFTSSRW